MSAKHGGEDVALIALEVIDDTTEVGRLRKLVRTLQDENHRLSSLHPKRANPAAVGLAGFGATTLLLQMHNLEWIGFDTVVWVGLFFGGLAQFIAGLMEFWTGNNFGFCAFTSYGAFWMSLGAVLISKQLKLYEVSETELGVFLLVFTMFTLLLWIGSMRINMALFLTFTLLLIGFILLDVHNLAGGIRGCKKAAAIVLILCALMAWYCMCNILALDLNKGKDYLPLGPAPLALIFDRKKKSRAITKSGGEGGGAVVVVVEKEPPIKA